MPDPLPAPKLESTGKFRKAVWHEQPRHGCHSTDACRWASSLAAALTIWFESAIAGELRYWPMRQVVSMTGPHRKTEDDFLSDCAAALAESVEWDGFILAQVLEKRGWPADADLVGRCSRWSCARRKARMDAYFSSKAKKEEGTSI